MNLEIQKISDLSYIAGLMDGEGSFSIQVQIPETKGVKSIRFNPRMSMTLKYGKEHLSLVQEYLGGKIYHYSDGMDRWYVGKKDLLLKALDDLYPFLRIKKEISQEFKRALLLFPSRKGKKAHERYWDKETTLEVARIALTLNELSTVRRFKTLDYLKEIEAIYE